MSEETISNIIENEIVSEDLKIQTNTNHETNNPLMIPFAMKQTTRRKSSSNNTIPNHRISNTDLNSQHNIVQSQSLLQVSPDILSTATIGVALELSTVPLQDILQDNLVAASTINICDAGAGYGAAIVPVVSNSIGESTIVRSGTPPVTLEHSLENYQCVICWDVVIDACTLVCSHTFCTYCIYRWVSRRPRCPVCRYLVVGMTADREIDVKVEAALATCSNARQRMEERARVRETRARDAEMYREIAAGRGAGRGGEDSSFNSELDSILSTEEDTSDSDFTDSLMGTGSDVEFEETDENGVRLVWMRRDTSVLFICNTVSQDVGSGIAATGRIQGNGDDADDLNSSSSISSTSSTSMSTSSTSNNNSSISSSDDIEDSLLSSPTCSDLLSSVDSDDDDECPLQISSPTTAIDTTNNATTSSAFRLDCLNTDRLVIDTRSSEDEKTPTAEDLPPVKVFVNNLRRSQRQEESTSVLNQMNISIFSESNSDGELDSNIMISSWADDIYLDVEIQTEEVTNSSASSSDNEDDGREGNDNDEDDSTLGSSDDEIFDIDMTTAFSNIQPVISLLDIMTEEGLVESDLEEMV